MSTDALAGMLAPAPTGVTHDTGTVVAVVDATHVSVDLGDRTVTAFLPVSLFGAAPAGAFVMLSLAENTYTVTGAAGGSAAGMVPIGAPIMWWSETLPAGGGWLWADGSTFSATTYPILAQVYPSLTLPDPRGWFLVPRKSGDSTFGTAWDTGGAKTVTLSEAEMPSHTHTESWASIDASKYVGGGGKTYSGDDMSVGTGSTTSAGGDEAHENLPPYKVFPGYIIRAA